MKDLRQCRIWLGDEPATIFRSTGAIFDPDTEAGRIVRLPLKDVRDRDLPSDLTDWCVYTCAVDGEKLHTEVIDYKETVSHARLITADVDPRSFVADDDPLLTP